ncbi:MAG: hypothetical protein Kow0037_08480 [Calditrichia bacterium]
MKRSRKEYYSRPHLAWSEFSGSSRRYFWWFFKRKEKIHVRPGAMLPDEVKKRIREIGVGKQVEILRIGYDGQVDERPILVEILDISNDYFTGKIINPERSLIEGATEKLVYAQQGGGVLDFYYNDGDIKEIEESRDEEILQMERNIEGLKEILAALEVNDRVIIAFYDAKQRGTLNAEGVIQKIDENGIEFDIVLEKINRIELERKIERHFNLEKDLVIDIEIV